VDRIRLLPDTPAARAQDVQVAPTPQVQVQTPPTGSGATLPGAQAAAAGVGLYPFLDDFESGTLQPHWTVDTTGSGYVSVTDLHGPIDNWHVVMATDTNSIDSISSITVELDLAGQTDVGILFRHKEFGDENHPEDGVFVSIDGLTWHEVVSLQGMSKEYVWRWVTLDPLLAGFGITFTSSFLVRFQWRDNFDIPSDGFAFDDIQIAPDVGVKPPPEIEQHIIALQAPQLWDKGFSGSGILIGNIDSGTNWMHPDLVQRVWTNPGEIAGNTIDDDGNGFIDDIHGWDFEFNGADVTSTDPHGTHTAGLMVGDGTDGRITGMAPAASLAICEVSNEADYWQAQQYLLDVGVDVVSSSYSYKWPDRPDYHMFRQLCDVELAAGIIHANSIGNQGVLLATHPVPFNISTPGNCPTPFAHPDQLGGGRSSVMACGGIQLPDDSHYNPSGRGPAAWEDLTLYDATWPHAQLPSFWDYPVGGFGGGLPGLIKPDVVTYTNSVMTTNLNSGYTLFSGTSAATPQLGGAMALLRDVQPNALPRHIAGALELSAVDLGSPGKDNIFGSGKIQVFNAARRLKVLARFSPPVASPGQAFDLEVFGAPNDVVYGFYQASLVTGTGELNLPFPLFFLGIRFLDAQGAAAWNLGVPNDVSLIGLTVWFQAASEATDLSWGAGPFFSVPDSLTIVP
jgi:subtilisin family serine protease